MELTPLAPSIGVQVSGVTPADLRDAGVARELLDALERHGVLAFRDLHIDDATQVEFSRMLGEPEILPMRSGVHPEIFVVSLDPEKALSAEYLKGTFYWHIDGATDDIPNKATMLHAIGIAADGGGTEFCNTYAAWDALPDDDKARYADVRVVHSFEAAQRLTTPDPTPEQLDYWRQRPSKEQPLAWKHESGRVSLVLGATVDHVAGMDPDAGRALVAELTAWATAERFVYRHEWAVGDLVIWDNRGTMHRALPYTADSERLMHRTTLVGEEAFA